MAEGGKRPLIENDKDKADFKFLLERTVDRFQQLQTISEEDKKKSKNKTRNTSSDGTSLSSENALKYTVLTIKKNSAGELEVFNDKPITPVVKPQPVVPSPSPTVAATKKKGNKKKVVPEPSVKKKVKTTTTPSAKVTTTTTTTTSSVQKKVEPATTPPEEVTTTSPPKEPVPLFTPVIYSDSDLCNQWHDKTDPELTQPPSVHLGTIQLNDKLDQVLCKLREETLPVDTTRTPSRSDNRRLIADFTSIYLAIQAKVRDDPESLRIYKTLFLDDFQWLLMRYISIFKVNMDLFLG